MKTIDIISSKKEELIDITSNIDDIVSCSDIKEGLCIVQVQHTTAAITINENADPDVKDDIIKGLKLFDDHQFNHVEGNSPAHIRSSLIGASETLIIRDSRLQLGTWQGVYFCEFDGPRPRKVIVTIIKIK